MTIKQGTWFLFHHAIFHCEHPGTILRQPCSTVFFDSHAVQFSSTAMQYSFLRQPCSTVFFDSHAVQFSSTAMQYSFLRQPCSTVFFDSHAVQFSSTAMQYSFLRQPCSTVFRKPYCIFPTCGDSCSVNPKFVLQTLWYRHKGF